MSARDKMSNTAEDLKGKVKEGTGKVTNDTELEAEGEFDQAKAKAKKAGEDVKDALSD